MCYSWYEDAEKSVKKDVAQEDPRKSVPESNAESRVRPEHSRFWTFRTGRPDRVTPDHVTEEATADRTLEKV
jgi:hypothetical protein